MAQPRYTIKAGDRVVLTRNQDGWSAALAPKDGGHVGSIPGSATIFSTPEEALADLKANHEIF